MPGRRNISVGASNITNAGRISSSFLEKKLFQASVSAITSSLRFLLKNVNIYPDSESSQIYSWTTPTNSSKDFLRFTVWGCNRFSLNCQNLSNCKTAILIFRQLLFLISSGLPFPFHLPLPVSGSTGISRWGWSGTQNTKKLEIAWNQYGPIAIWEIGCMVN